MVTWILVIGWIVVKMKNLKLAGTKLDKIDVQELLFCLDMFRGFYLEGRYNDKFSYGKRIEEAHWYLDFANLILDEAMKK